MAGVRIGFIGGGEMGGALAAAAKRYRPLVSTRTKNRNPEIARKCELVFVCVRPKDVPAVADEIRPLLHAGQTVVSIAAGLKLARLRQLFGRKVSLIRVMPNLGVKVGCGMCAMTKSRSPHSGLVREILASAGRVAELPEKDFDAFTAVAGSGPAYFAYMLGAMANGGEKLGLKQSAAREFALQTMMGTAKFLAETGADVEAFVARVATPGGTTAAGKTALDENGAFAAIVSECLKRCAARSRELGR